MAIEAGTNQDWGGALRPTAATHAEVENSLDTPMFPSNSPILAIDRRIERSAKVEGIVNTASQVQLHTSAGKIGSPVLPLINSLLYGACAALNFSSHRPLLAVMWLAGAGIFAAIAAIRAKAQQ